MRHSFLALFALVMTPVLAAPASSSQHNSSLSSRNAFDDFVENVLEKLLGGHTARKRDTTTTANPLTGYVDVIHDVDDGSDDADEVKEVKRMFLPPGGRRPPLTAGKRDDSVDEEDEDEDEDKDEGTEEEHGVEEKRTLFDHASRSLDTKGSMKARMTGWDDLD